MRTTTLVACCAACMLFGYVASSSKFDPMHPLTPARPDRPVARILARIARLGLWAAMFAEPSPSPEARYTAIHARCPSDSMICHAEGW